MNAWLAEFRAINPPLLSRADFVARYFPQYVKDYRPPPGIKMVKGASGRLHVQMTTAGSVKAQVTRRSNRIDSAYVDYCATWKADRQASCPQAVTQPQTEDKNQLELLH
jgi:hypothetical protein